jgi:3-keto-5-aminohexanoate cleavage enzyme
LEDNVYCSRGNLAKINAQLVERTVRIAKELNRPIATPIEAREILGMSKTPKKY